MTTPIGPVPRRPEHGDVLRLPDAPGRARDIRCPLASTTGSPSTTSELLLGRVLAACFVPTPELLQK